ncbi:MAG: DMT family transporter [Anaerolineae bacterium]
MHVFRRPSPHIVLLIGLLAVSSASIFIRYAQAEATPSLVIAAMRLSLAALMLTPFALRQPNRQHLSELSPRQKGLAVLAGVFLAFHFAFWITSLEHVSVLISVVLVTTSPLWVALLSPVLLKEPLQKKTVVGIVLAFVGGVLVSAGGQAILPTMDASPLLGSLLSILGALAVAFYIIIGRHIRATVPVVPYTWLTYSAAALTLLMMVLVSGQQLIGYSNRVYLWLLLLAVFPQAIGHTSFNYALGSLPAAYVSLVILGEPVASAILAFILLGETPTAIQLAGSALILFAVLQARQQTPPVRSPAPNLAD